MSRNHAMPVLQSVRSMIVGAACCVTAWGVSAQGLSGVITGQIVSTSPVYHRTSDRQSAGTYAASSNLAVPYAVHEIRMPANGSVQVVVDNTTPFDSFLALYSSFNPANPQAGLLAADDDSAGYPHARLNVSGLRAATS